MQSMVDTLNGYLGQQVNQYGDPSFALIPQRLPTVSFFQREYAEFMLNFTDEHGQRVTRHYNGQGQRLGLNGEVESTFADGWRNRRDVRDTCSRAARQGRRGSSFAEDFLNEVMGQNAIVPTWEADTIY